MIEIVCVLGNIDGIIKFSSDYDQVWGSAVQNQPHNSYNKHCTNAY